MPELLFGILSTLEQSPLMFGRLGLPHPFGWARLSWPLTSEPRLDRPRRTFGQSLWTHPLLPCFLNGGRSWPSRLQAYENAMAANNFCRPQVAQTGFIVCSPISICCISLPRCTLDTRLNLHSPEHLQPRDVEVNAIQAVTTEHTITMAQHLIPMVESPARRVRVI
eukprot:scaffold77124_cov31-Tisochrysis_lutea.AAC.1